MNPPKFEKCEDMSNFSFLSDASILANLRARYSVMLIYVSMNAREIQQTGFKKDISRIKLHIGPRVFLSCPFNMEESRQWFVDLWNQNIHPYLVQATREGAQMGRGRGSLEDPTDFVCDSWPWTDDVVPDVVLARL